MPQVPTQLLAGAPPVPDVPPVTLPPVPALAPPDEAPAPAEPDVPPRGAPPVALAPLAPLAPPPSAAARTARRLHPARCVHSARTARCAAGRGTAGQDRPSAYRPLTCRRSPFLLRRRCRRSTFHPSSSRRDPLLPCTPEGARRREPRTKTEATHFAKAKTQGACAKPHIEHRASPRISRGVTICRLRHRFNHSARAELLYFTRSFSREPGMKECALSRLPPLHRIRSVRVRHRRPR